jgi:RNA polymerase sigma-70 factor (ECF subfamily)
VSDHDDWVERLNAAGACKDAALAELRLVLVRGLRQALPARGGDEAFVQDTAQEALLKILDSLQSFAGRSRFTTWAMTIAVRIGVTELRRKRFQDVSLERVMAGKLAVDLATDLTGSPDQKERRALILETLKRLVEQKLTDKQRTVVQAGLEGLPFEEIGRRLNMNRNAVYKMFHDARQKLRQGFEAAGIMAEDVQAALS